MESAFEPWACGHIIVKGRESCPICDELRAQAAEIARLKVAIATHRLVSWGEGYIDHPPDVDLYRAAGMPLEDYG